MVGRTISLYKIVKKLERPVVLKFPVAHLLNDDDAVEDYP